MDLSTRQGRREQGLRIQQAIENAQFSIEELAGRIGCSRALIYQYLSGSTLAQPDRLQQISVECGVPLEYFYTDEPTIPETPELHIPGVEVTARLSDSLRSLQELADAQEGPPDYRALTATCERILSLSEQLGDRQVMARTLKQLGNARLRLADYPGAAEALERAIQQAHENGDLVSETASRQSLGHAYVSMGRHREAREQFEQIAQGTIFTGRWQGILSLGGLHEMHGEYDRAMARFDEVSALLEEAAASGSAPPSEIQIGQIYVNTNRRNVYMDGGDFRGARALAEQGMAEAEALGSADQHLESRFDQAWCDFHTGRWNESSRSLNSSLKLARFVGDQGRETIVRAWLGIFQAAAGHYDQAMQNGKDALAAALSRGDRRAELYAQLALTDAYTGAGGRESEARYHCGQALAVTFALRHERGEIECRIRQARLCVQAEELTELQEAAERAGQLAKRLGARHLESLALCWSARYHLEQAKQQTEQSPEDALTRCRELAEQALALATQLELLEGQWRAHAVLSECNSEHSERNIHMQEAIRLLEGLRQEIRTAELEDTLLENRDVLEVYRYAARQLSAEPDQLRVFLENTGWPPLNALIQRGETAPESRLNDRQ